MNFLRNLLQGSTSAAKTDAALKKKGPVAAGGLGGPFPGSEGQREAVITQESTNSVSPPHSPASTQSEASLPGLSQEYDTASTGDDTSSTPCVTCVSEVPSSSLSEAPKPQGSTRHHESLGNSVSDSVGQSITQNGVKKDSEYESAEELDSPLRNSLQLEEAPQVPSTAVSLETEECFERKSVHAPLSDSQTDTDSFHPSAVNVPVCDRTESGNGVSPVKSVETDATIETVVVSADTTTKTANTAITDSVSISSAESEQPVNTICESVVTVTKNEVIEESIVENTVLVEQQVIATTRPSHSTSSPEPDKPVDVNEINLDIVILGDTYDAGSCEPPICAPVDVSEAKEAGDQAAPSGEGEDALESRTDVTVTEEPIVSEANSKPEHAPHSSREVNTPTPRQGTEHSIEEKTGETREATDTPETLGPEQHTTSEDTSTTSFTVSEQKEESPLPLPPPDPDDIPILPKKGYDLDFLDNLDDPNFNPFASKTTIRNTPPPSPEPGHKLPPLKPAVKKKSKKAPEAVNDNSARLDSDAVKGKLAETQVEANSQNSSSEEVNESPPPSRDASKTFEPQQEAAENNARSAVLDISVKDGDSPAKTPVKPLRKPPQRKPLGKSPLKPKVTENNNRVEEEVSQAAKEDEDLPIAPSKGYNLDFLDNLDPNFNPFSCKTSVRNSPPSSGAASPASQHSQEKAGEQEAKVVVAKKSLPKKGFAAPRKSSEVENKSLEAREVSIGQVNQKQETLEASCIKKPEPSPSEEKAEKEEEELTVAKKGYNLDFLDDPNFDPFKSISPLDKADSDAKSKGVNVPEDESSVIANSSAKVVESRDKPKPVKYKAVPSEDSLVEHKQPEILIGSDLESEKEVVDSAVEQESAEAETESQEFTDNPPEFTEDNLNSEPTNEPKNQTTETQENDLTKDINQTTNYQNLGPLPDSENNWDTENVEPHSGRLRTPSIGTIGQLDSLEFDQLLEHEASRIAEEFMNCSRDSGLPDYDESPDSHNSNLAMADMSCTNIRHMDENVNPFQKSSRLANSPPLGKRGAVCGAESTESRGPPFASRRSLKRDIVLGEERLDTLSLEDDSGIVLGSRSDLETEVNHSEAGPEIATGLTSSDLKCASQFFKEVTDLENHMRRNLVSPILGSHSKLSGDEVTPTKEKKEPPAGAPDFPQNKPTPSTSSPAPPPREERSAPEGTSSPSPRPSDTAERKSLSARPTSAPPEGYMTASEVQELLKRQELKFEEKLLRVELASGEKEKKLQQTMKDEQKELQTLGSSVTELTQSRDALLKMVGQYKGMLASLVTEKEKEKKASEEKINSLQAERDQALEDLANVEVAFSDVHRKYERTKQVVDTLKRNEETLRGAVADYEAKLKKQEQKFLEFQKHAEEKIQMANEEFESMRKSNEQEMTKMAALLKKAEMKIMSLQDSFDRKTRENQELTQLCDDLINKVGTSH